MLHPEWNYNCCQSQDLLIPLLSIGLQSLDLMGEDSHVAEVYLWRALVVLAGIYLFFTVERALEAAVARKRVSQHDF